MKNARSARSQEDNLRQGRTRRDDALEGVLHDIRNSAATVALLVRMLQEHGDDSAATRASIEGIANCARAITQLVDDAKTTTATRLDLVVDDVADQIRLLHQGRLTVATEPVLVLARRIDLVRIMTNLLDNARAATDGDEAITVFVSREGPRATARITNPTGGSRPVMSGTGISVVRRLVTYAGGDLSIALREDEVDVVVEFPVYDGGAPEPGAAS